jgi:hypothetical protein
MRGLVTFVGSSVSHADWLALSERGVAIEWVSIADLLTDARIEIGNGRSTVVTGLEGRSVLWYNPGCFGALELDLRFGHVGDQGDFILRQYTALLACVEDGLDCIDPPSLQRRRANKLLQAVEMNTLVPDLLIETRVTSDPREMRPGDVAKHVSETRRVTDDTAFYAYRLSAGDITDMTSGARTPIICQPFIGASHEYRTFWFGEHAVTVQIPRPDSGSEVDIQFFPKLIADAKVVETPVELPWSRIRDGMGLSMFAIDYVIPASGPLVFEMNPVFSWAWLPPDCVDPVAEAVKRALENF